MQLGINRDVETHLFLAAFNFVSIETVLHLLTQAAVTVRGSSNLKRVWTDSASGWYL